MTTQLAFSGKAGPIADAMITGVLFKTAEQGESRGVINKTKCNLIVSRLNSKEAAGKASCAPMFKMDGTTTAPPVSDISFSATLTK